MRQYRIIKRSSDVSYYVYYFIEIKVRFLFWSWWSALKPDYFNLNRNRYSTLEDAQNMVSVLTQTISYDVVLEYKNK